LRQILIAEGITFQRTKTWKESPDPLKESKLARIEWLLEHTRDRTFAFDEFGPLTIKPAPTASTGMGALLARELVAAGEHVVDVPAGARSGEHTNCFAGRTALHRCGVPQAGGH